MKRRNIARLFAVLLIVSLMLSVLEICPVRAENVFLTVSYRASQSLASRISGSMVGIISSGRLSILVKLLLYS